jgi:predicted helicase
VDKEVKAGRSEEAVFKIFSAEVKTQRDEWVYDFSKDTLIEKIKYLIDGYMQQLTHGNTNSATVPPLNGYSINTKRRNPKIPPLPNCSTPTNLLTTKNR